MKCNIPLPCPLGYKNRCCTSCDDRHYCQAVCNSNPYNCKYAFNKDKTFNIWTFLLELIIIALLIIAFGNHWQIIEEQEAIKADLSEVKSKLDITYHSEEKVAETGYYNPITLLDTERDLIERVVMAESGNQGLEGMKAVAQTIKDRSELWNMTPTEVVTQPHQFAKPYSYATEEVKLAVAKVFDNGERVFEEPVTHFHNQTVKPYWTENKVNRGTIREHTFYY